MTAFGAEILASVLEARDRAQLTEIFGARASFDTPLAPYTSWKVGGPADALVFAETSAELAQMLRLVAKRKIPWYVLGSGSNLLVGDGGIRGIVVRLGGEFASIDFIEDDADRAGHDGKGDSGNDVVPGENGSPGSGSHVVVRAGASSSLALLAGQAANRGALGIDGLAGIPGSVGGSLRMNAGTDREIGEFVRDVWVQTPGKPEPHAVTAQYFYRHTTLARDAVVAFATLAFERGDPVAVRARLQERLVRRKNTQPLQFANAGSCFRNPPGDKAGRLIEAAGAKGWREGGAEVSELHANFILNRGDASASDVASLLARVRRAVVEQFGVELELEVHFVGVFA